MNVSFKKPPKLKQLQQNVTPGTWLTNRDVLRYLPLVDGFLWWMLLGGLRDAKQLKMGKGEGGKLRKHWILEKSGSTQHTTYVRGRSTPSSNIVDMW